MKSQKPIIHGRDHSPGGPDPLKSFGAADGDVLSATGDGGIEWATSSAGSSSPRIIDYFNNSGSPHLDPATDTPGGGDSSNYVQWTEQANWSGYNHPEPWIAVDDLSPGTDTDGYSATNRWVYVPTMGTDYDGVTVGGSALIRCMFMLELPDANAGQWFDVTATKASRSDAPNGVTAWGSIASVSGNYGWRSDFPVCSDAAIDSTIGNHRRSASLEFYQQVSSGMFWGFSFLLVQSAPFIAFPHCQLIVEIVKNYAFEGERTV